MSDYPKAMYPSEFATQQDLLMALKSNPRYHMDATSEEHEMSLREQGMVTMAEIPENPAPPKRPTLSIAKRDE